MAKFPLMHGDQEIQLPEKPPNYGWVVAVRLRKTERVKQGQWAIMVQPVPDGLSAFNLVEVENREIIPDNAIVYTKREDAHARAEEFKQWAGYEASGDFELVYVRQKMIVSYQGWEKTSRMRDP